MGCLNMLVPIRRHLPNVLCTVSLVSASALATDDRAEIDASLAGQYLQEVRVISARDAGRLWGVRLYGPMLFVDPASRAIVANQADQAGLLRERDGAFVGSFPTDRSVANAPTRWSGTYWAMIVWPLPRDQRSRGRLMAHELWHCIQHELWDRVDEDLGMPNTANAHLDTLGGRIALQLEWRALEAALKNELPARRPAGSKIARFPCQSARNPAIFKPRQTPRTPVQPTE